MKYKIEVDLDDIENLYSLFPLRNIRKKELKEAKEALDKYVPKSRGFSGFLLNASEYTKLYENFKKAERLLDIDQSVFHCVANDLEIFLLDVYKQIELQKEKE